MPKSAFPLLSPLRKEKQKTGKAAKKGQFCKSDWEMGSRLAGHMWLGFE